MTRATLGPIDTLRRSAWLHRERIVAWGTILFALETLFLVFLACWQHGVFSRAEAATSSDFVSFYAAGKLVLAGTPALAYDQSAHYLAEQAARGPSAPYQFFFYPPVYLLLCAVLATLPYYVAYALLEIGTLLPFIFVMRSITQQQGWGWLGPLLAFPAVFWTIGLGQNAFLTAALLGGFTLLVDRRPRTAGMLLGLLCYKPHFGLLVPIALLAGRRWLVFMATGATAVVLVGLSVALFGVETWRAYLAAFAGSQSVYATGRIDYAGIITPFGAARLIGALPDAANAVQAVATVAMAVLVGWIWHRNRGGHAVCSAVLLSATLLAVPLALVYDQLLLLVAMGWLLRAAGNGGFRPWEKIALASIYPLSLLTWPIGSGFQVPLGPLGTAVILVLCARRAGSAPTASQAGATQAGATQAEGATP